MAVKHRQRGRFWSRLHFLVRFLGLTGLLVGGVGLGLALLQQLPLPRSVEEVQAIFTVEDGFASVTIEQLARMMLLGGAAAALVAILVELLVVMTMVAGRRSAFGFNVVIQTALAAAILVGVNVFSFEHPKRFDWTRNREFTLPADVTDQLRQLRSDTKTKVIVLQRHKTFGQTEKADAYDFAAERKVVEKVKDLVEQLREFGPQFQIVTLDVEEEGYNDKLARETEGADELRKAIDAAPDNSIFFYATDDTGRAKVQRLSFEDFYRLDKTASQEANDGKGNLVLLYQGVEPFARKVLNIDEKRPRVGIAVVHEWLTSEGLEEYGLMGLRKALVARGFDVRDVVLKKWSQFAPPEPAVYTYEESKLDRIEERLVILDTIIKNMEEADKDAREIRELWRKSTLDELTKKYASQLRGRKVTEAMRKTTLEDIDAELADLDAALAYNRKRRDAAAGEKSKLNVDSLAEQRRMSDLKAKFDRSLAECDLLILPRMTLRNVNIGDFIPNRIYRLDEAQVEAVRDFLKAGKPVLACFGPTNESPDRPSPPDMAGPDRLEDLLAELGIRLGRQTVLFDVESESFAERRTNQLLAAATVEVPPLEFDWRQGIGRPLGRVHSTEDLPPNPIREAMRLTARSVGKDRSLDLRLRYPRPVYYDWGDGKRPDFDPDFLMTSPASWNDEQPFPTQDRTPRYERPKQTDPTRGTLDEKRRGPFPVGVAVQTNLPTSWYDGKGNPAVVRVAAIGQGGWFVGGELSPAKEQLAVNTCNWLLGRDDLLPKGDQQWQYPRVQLFAFEHDVWRWGTGLGLPLVFAYLGVVVYMIRRLR